MSYQVWPLPQEFYLSVKMLVGAATGTYMAWAGRLPSMRFPRYAIIGAVAGFCHHQYIKPRFPDCGVDQHELSQAMLEDIRAREQTLRELGIRSAPPSSHDRSMFSIDDGPRLRDYLRSEELLDKRNKGEDPLSKE